ncbi:lycopene cyclase domain-containing protein [Halorubellus sp. PRR65]|uniref:lycopene cyclase domain-containing protein n=1 Tax=Halorubellus sp. PRR65 TaxID=3098148 RepID=UPI002B260AC7|nr:lycopene cyclase domain-containing protein [Halorubellus sp. PRR65]
MTDALTYVAFHLAFVVPALVAVAALRRARGLGEWTRTLKVGTPVVVVLAVAYTTPWDNYLVARGVWTYGEGTVLARLWWAPVEEYAFFVLQSVLAALWVGSLGFADVADATVSRRQRVAGALAAGAVTALGLAWTLQGGQTLYLGAILAWAGPVLAVQWAFGWPVLVRARRTVLLGVLAPTLYLCVADRVAIDAGVWTLSETYTTGVLVLGLPVEEGLFFLVTNVFVAQSLVLLRWVYAAPAAAVPAPLRRFVRLETTRGEGVPR